MSEMGKKPGWRQAPGWMKLLLIVSLSVNVAIAGLVEVKIAVVAEEGDGLFPSEGML